MAKKRSRPTNTRPSKFRRNVKRSKPSLVNSFLVRQVRAQGRAVRAITSMIETKEGSRLTGTNVGLSHNNLTVVQDSAGGALNPFLITQGVADPMAGSASARIGDKITVRGLLIRAFFENSLQRPKVYYRVMVIKMAKGDTLSRSTFFKGICANKMIDQANTERFTVVAQKVFNIGTSNTAPNGLNINGTVATGMGAGIGTKTFKMWIPGKKFGRGGNLTYEDGAAQQLKFYDYRLAIVAYDWAGTPQDITTVGQINEMYTKVYFKDA